MTPPLPARRLHGEGGPSPWLRPAGARAVAGVMAEVSAIGPYFAVSTAAGETAGPDWRPLTALHSDIGALRAWTGRVGRRLGTGETRVAASILFQGLAARFWSPVVGAVAARGLLPDLDPARVRWLPAASGPLPLRAARPTGWEITDPDRAAAPVYRAVVTELLEPLALAVQEVTGIAPRLLWGNAASALAGILPAVAPERPDLVAPAASLIRGLLALGVLEGSGDLAEPAPGHHFFVRRSCCLYYRLPAGGMCGDCVLLSPEVRHGQWAQALRQAETGPFMER
ncbi:(2Fe-2S)-binding protein [Streptosporangium sp. NBC_01756]|uniref:(2Fe-2S)-binding protein n=1 Tax=Streptosporangium sp. NBC_01756 TaxID=2975950 RepID=UPI002DDBAC22|nr:(2Fe-2S)-binding protein [Streptosporangium sp. NBC_01756]WSC86837.1 (2Fe-2S)-binding protein [Streptosporangium sp. NBC_01756]